MSLDIDIKPQFKKIANWYWNEGGGYEGQGMSIWGVLERDYGARQTQRFGPDKAVISFPNEQMYTAFLLRWS